MRRPALVLGCLLIAASVASLDCTERLWLPASGFDGGMIADGSNPGSGGLGIGRDGSFGQGERGGRMGASGGGGRGGQSCQTSVKLPLQKTRMVFSVGKNGSMTKPFGNSGATRLGAVEQLLQSVISDNLNAVNFGYQDFPGTAPCPASIGCCSGAFIPPDSTTWGAIQGQLQCGPPPAVKGCATSADSRPIGAALQAALPLFTANDGADHQLVLLVDGDPSCTSSDPAQLCEAAKVARAQLRNMGLVTTFVVAVGSDPATSSCLSELALEGGHPLATASDPPQLSDIVRDIVNAAAAPSCVINLMSTVDPATVRLFLSGHEVMPFGSDGWDFVPGPVLKIQVKGSSCHDLQRTPEAQVQVLGCPL